MGKDNTLELLKHVKMKPEPIKPFKVKKHSLEWFEVNSEW